MHSFNVVSYNDALCCRISTTSSLLSLSIILLVLHILSIIDCSFEYTQPMWLLSIPTNSISLVKIHPELQWMMPYHGTDSSIPLIERLHSLSSQKRPLYHIKACSFTSNSLNTSQFSFACSHQVTAPFTRHTRFFTLLRCD